MVSGGPVAVFLYPRDRWHRNLNGYDVTMEIAVLGGGNGAYATAADLALHGHTVRWWRRDSKAFGPVLQDKMITLIDGDGRHQARIALPTTNLVEAVSGGEVVIVPLPAFAQKELAAKLAPILEDGQLVLLTPGSFGSYVMASQLRRLGCVAKVTLAESATLPYLTRKLGIREVGVTGRATTLPFGVYPGRMAGAVGARLRLIFPGATIVEDSLDAALLNAGPIIHPPLIILNAAALEHSASYDIHKEGTQPCTRAAQEALDSERILVREQLGYRGPHYPLRDYYEGHEWFYEESSRDRLVDSSYWRERVDLRTHRYVAEDIVFGLAFMVSVAAWAGVDVPVARGLLAITSAIVGQDLREAGRTLASTGLASLSASEVKERLREGPRDVGAQRTDYQATGEANDAPSGGTRC
jgi:opine dehydrogenase